MNREVFLSILAMDSYQRGYAPGINGVSGTKIGKVSLVKDSSSLLENGQRLDIPVGFFAQSYTFDETYAGIGAGTTVISYRGTDFDLGEQLVRDFIFGWSTFTGLWKASQFPLAQKFYKAVTTQDCPSSEHLALIGA